VSNAEIEALLRTGPVRPGPKVLRVKPIRSTAGKILDQVREIADIVSMSFVRSAAAGTEAGADPLWS
jgi:hypothetical protein